MVIGIAIGLFAIVGVVVWSQINILNIQIRVLTEKETNTLEESENIEFRLESIYLLYQEYEEGRIEGVRENINTNYININSDMEVLITTLPSHKEELEKVKNELDDVFLLLIENGTGVLDTIDAYNRKKTEFISKENFLDNEISLLIDFQNTTDSVEKAVALGVELEYQLFIAQEYFMSWSDSVSYELRREFNQSRDNFYDNIYYILTSPDNQNKSLANQIHDWYKLDFLALIETHITGIFDLVDHLHENYKQMNLKKQDINTILVELHHEMELKIAQDKVCAKQDAFTLQLLILIVTFVVTPSITLITSIVQRCLLKKLYKNLFNNVTNGVALYDAKNDGKDFIIKDFNISGERIECVKKEDIIGKSVLKIFPGVKDLGLFEVFQRVWKTGKSEYHPTSYYQDKRIQGWRENYVYKLPNGQIVAIYNDTTDKKLAKLLIKELEEKYRILVQSSSASIILLNLKGEIIDCNDRTKDLFSICKSELIGKKFQNLVIFKDISQWTEKEFMEIIKKELEEPRIFSFINKDGKFYFLKSTFSLLKMEKKNYIQVISYDITSQKKAEILIEKQLKKLRELDQIKNDLIQRIAHELRTPLTSIYSGSEFLLNHCREKIDIRTQKFLKIINKGGYRLKELVDNLLLTFNIESNSLKLEFQDSNIIPIIEESIKSIAHIASKRKILIYKKFHDNLYLDMDNSKIKKVISNLILNAIQNTLKNGSVYISTIKNGNFIEIIIEDTGVGFTEREKKMIFKKFGKIERYGNGMNIDTEGPGLGLYIANKITEMHGGKIWVKSKGRNKGSTFIVRLPIKQ